MFTTRTIAAATLVVAMSAPSLGAQDLSRYREYALGSSVAAVTAASGVRESDVRTTHQRPAHIQEVYWRAGYVGIDGAPADPVRDVLFSFFDDQLYQVIVTYYRDRMDGLTDADVVESLSAAYGTPTAPRARSRMPAGMPADAMVVARWEDAAAVVTLTRSPYAPEFQLLLTSKAIGTRAGAAIAEAVRLDAREAPQRALDRHTKDVAAARAASQKARAVNKAAFKP